MPLIWLTFFSCVFETMIMVWILTLCIFFISYEQVYKKPRKRLVLNKSLSGLFVYIIQQSNTVLSTRSVLWTSDMPKMRWGPSLFPIPLGALILAPSALETRRLRRLDLWLPISKSWLRAWLTFSLQRAMGTNEPVIFYERAPYSQRYLFNANPDTNHNANPTRLLILYY